MMMVVEQILLIISCIVLFWIILILLWNRRREYFEKRGIEVGFPVIIWRRAISLKWAEKLQGSSRARRILDIGVALSIISAALFYYYTFTTLILRLRGVPASETGGFAPLIPGLTVTWSNVVYIVVGISIAVVIHELSHGLAAVAEGTRIKSAGLALFLAVPGAFVEIDEQEFSASTLRTKLRILGAGTAANFILALILLPLLFSAFTGSGVMVVEVKPDSPAYRAGIIPGSQVLVVNNTQIVSLGQLLEVLDSVKESGKPFTMKLRSPDGREYEVTIVMREGEKLIGVLLQFSIGPPFNMIPYPLGWELFMMTLWIFNINLGLALINAAPILILDGGRMLTETLQARLGSTGKSISYTIQILTLLLLLGSMYIPGI